MDGRIQIMASVKATLDIRRVKKDGRFPIKLRVTHQSISRDMGLNISIHIHDWSFKKEHVKKAHPNHLQINKLIHTKKTALEATILDLALGSVDFKVQDIIQHGKVKKKEQVPTFKVFGYQIIESYKLKHKYGTARSYKNAVDQVCNRLHDKVKLSDIDYNLLLKYEQILIQEGMSVNGIANLMRHLKAIINRAIKSGYLKREDYAFHNYQIKTEKTRKRALSMSEFQNILAQELPADSKEHEAREYFILIFCLIGINWIDLANLKPEDLLEDKIIYKRRKTKKLYDVLLSSMAKEIIDKLWVPSSKYLLPILPNHELTAQEERAWTDNKLRLCNKFLKKLGERCKLQYPLTTYVARHSWATTAKHLGFSNELIAEALGHDYGLNVTNIYLDNFDKSKVYEANLAVQEYVLGKVQ